MRHSLELFLNPFGAFFIFSVFLLLSCIRKYFKPVPKGFIRTTGLIKDYITHPKNDKFSYPIITFVSEHRKEYTFTDKKRTILSHASFW